jgi:hypothetical protein
MRTTVLVNRVSDAAEPHLIKACLAVLELIVTASQLSPQQQQRRVVVFNGPRSYSLCSNKWCHHVLFQRAGLEEASSSPKTIRIMLAEDVDDEQSKNREMIRQAISTHFSSSSVLLLIKPNAGGFGAGIVQFHKDDDLLSTTTSSSSIAMIPSSSYYTDHMCLLQEYIPTPHFVHRVWFLQGKVQCGVIMRRINNDSTLSDNNNKLLWTSGGGGCMAGGAVCRRQTTTTGTTTTTTNQQQQQQQSQQPLTIISAYTIPDSVRHEIEHQLLPLLSDIHAGSVEFIVNAKHPDQRFYVDLNMLSTLPILDDDDNDNNKKIQNAAKVWGLDYDPWKELAQAIIDYGAVF